jgi:chemotaxis signal transduction protein
MEEVERDMSITGLSSTAQYLTFEVADEMFAMEVAKVVEILGYMNKFPRESGASVFNGGAINFRGSVVQPGDLGLDPEVGRETDDSAKGRVLLLDASFESRDPWKDPAQS